MNEPTTSATLPAAAEPPVNILIVDDEPANLLVLESLLHGEGYRIVRAESAEAALMALMEHEFALLILDIRMPVMSGFELARMIKERKKTARIPIIFLTAYYDKDQHAVQGYDSGAVDFLSKPVNPIVLRSKVAVFVDLYRKTSAVVAANRVLTAEIAERRRAEEALRELNDTLERRVEERSAALLKADRRLQALMGSITDGLLMIDRDWRFSFVNEQGARLLGHRREALQGSCVWDLFPGLREMPLGAVLQRAAGGAHTDAFEAFYPPPANRWLQCHCYPLGDGVSVYFHDISERRQVQERQEQLLLAEQAARNEGERLVRAKDEFLASLSHELRTPLAAIVGWARVIRHPSADGEILRRGQEAIARNADALSRLVGDLLDTGRIVSGKLHISREKVDLNSIATDAADTAMPAAQAKALAIHVQLHPGSLDVLGEQARLQQVAANLVANALKFTPAGGTVTIRTARSGDQAELVISDTGQGITASFLPRLFERFSQADSSMAREHGGLGLGLSIVKNLVDAHGGSIDVSSAGPGKGSTFTVRLPLAPRLMPPAPPGDATGVSEASRAPDLGGAAQGLSILVVEDYADTLELERRVLVEHGATVTAVASADEALQALQRGRFDVLLSDLGLPVTDGYELIRAVRTTLGLTAGVLPAAAVTGFVRQQDRERALRAGYQACVSKPIEAATLVRAVVELCRPAVDRAAPEASDTEAPSRMRALFVEDNRDLQELLRLMLEEEGLEVVCCDNAEDAEGAYLRGGFDLLVTDISLGKMTGIDLARRVLAVEPATWIVFSTGYPIGPAIEEIGRNVRALMKPYEAEDLRKVLTEIRASFAAMTS